MKRRGRLCDPSQACHPADEAQIDFHRGRPKLVQKMCIDEAEMAAVKDFPGGLVFADEIEATVTAVDERSFAPLFSAGTATAAAELGGDYVKGSRAAQKVIRTATAGAMSANAAGRFAGRVATVAKVFGAVLSLNAGREAYDTRMAR